MVKLIIFFRKPADVDAFEEHFANYHVPLINAMPNMRRAAVTRAIGAPRGEAPYYLIHEVYFEDMPALNYALNSSEGRAAGADLMVFAREIVSLMFAEVWGEDPFELGLMGSEPAPVEEAVETVAEPAPAAKPNLVPIDTSFLEKGPAAATPATEPAPNEAAVADSPVTESAVIDAAQTETPAATEATPAQTVITESAVIDEASAPAGSPEAATPSDTPAPEPLRPQ